MHQWLRSTIGALRQALAVWWPYAGHVLTMCWTCNEHVLGMRSIKCFNRYWSWHEACIRDELNMCCTGRWYYCLPWPSTMHQQSLRYSVASTHARMHDRQPARTHAHPPARAPAHMHTCTHARMRARAQTQLHGAGGSSVPPSSITAPWQRP